MPRTKIMLMCIITAASWTCRTTAPLMMSGCLPTDGTDSVRQLLADHGLAEACRQQPALATAINVMDGQVTHPAVAQAHSLKSGRLSLP